MNQRLTAFLAGVLCWMMVFGQKEDYIWYFGPTGVGLDFRGCEPQVLTDGYADGNAWEGCATIADSSDGSLLFYTSGYKAYNSLRQPMPNGDPIGLSNSLSQMVIIPWPGSPMKYFLVIPEVQAGVSWMPQHPAAFSLYYAVIDMALDGGLGDVASKFNVMLTTPHCEFLTAVRHGNGSDYWLIGHEFNSSTFFTYAITPSGISSVPTFQSVGPTVATPQSGPPNSSNLDAVGAMRSSPDGTHLAYTTSYNGITCVFDFDPWTGSITAPKELSISGGGYGISFSPNGSKLFVATKTIVLGNTFQDGALVQFDLSSGSQDVIQASLTTIHQCIGNGGFATLKLGPNGRLYASRISSDGTSQGDPFIGVVNEPDLPGSMCDYVHDGVWLNGSYGSWGLSNSLEFGHDCGGLEHSITENECDDLELVSTLSLHTISWRCMNAFNKIEIRSSDGRILLDRIIENGSTQFSWSLPRGIPGIYVVCLTGPDGKAVRKLLLP